MMPANGKRQHDWQLVPLHDEVHQVFVDGCTLVLLVVQPLLPKQVERLTEALDDFVRQEAVVGRVVLTAQRV